MKHIEMNATILRLASELGIRVVTPGATALAPHAHRDGYVMRIAMPVRGVEVTIDHHELDDPQVVVKKLLDGQRRLYTEVLELIAQHDRGAG